MGADLAGVDLHGTNLDNADLKEADLNKTDLRKARLYRASLIKANLREANLMGTDLLKADLREANLIEADLSGATLMACKLDDANLSKAKLEDADLSGANLSYTNLNNSLLKGAKFKSTRLSSTILVDVDLSETDGLNDAWHWGMSSVDNQTLRKSKGTIPVEFLLGCGLSDWEVESAKLYKPGLSAKQVNDIVYRIYDLRANQAIQINPLFISYSHKDGEFVDEMEKHLDKKGIRFWRDIHDAPAGPLEKIVDRAMRLNPTVLLVLSENSVKSDWVEHEAESARELEKKLGRHVLCPVALDEAWKDCGWEMRLRRQIMKYNILDFSKWEDEGVFEKMFRKLIDGLDLFYKEK